MALCAIHARKCNSDECKVPFCKVIRGSATPGNASHQTLTNKAPNNMSKLSAKAKLQLKKNVPNKIFLPVIKPPPSIEDASKANLVSRRMGYIETNSKKPRISTIFDEGRNYEKESNIVRCDWTAEDSNKDSSSCTPTDKDIAEDNLDEANGHDPERKSEGSEPDLCSTDDKPVTSSPMSMSPEEKAEPAAAPPSPPTDESHKEKAIHDDDDDFLQRQKIKLGDEDVGIKITTVAKNFKLDSIALCASGVLLAPLFSYVVVKILKAAARTY